MLQIKNKVFLANLLNVANLHQNIIPLLIKYF